MRCAVRGHLIKVPGTKIQHHYKCSAVKLGKQNRRVQKLSSGTLRKKMRIFASFGRVLGKVCKLKGSSHLKLFLKERGLTKMGLQKICFIQIF